MSLLEITNLGKSLGLEGDNLIAFIKEQQDYDRDERQKEREEREKEREERQKEGEREERRLIAEEKRLKAEKEKIEKEILLRGRHDSDNESVENHASSLNSVSLKLLPKFNESDVTKFFIAFEKIAVQLGWQREMWPILVQSVLVGKSQTVYASLSDEESKDYEQLKDAILNAYELIPESYRQRFRGWKKLGNQTYIEFAHQKGIKFDEWLRSAGANDFKSLKQLILVEDFKNCIPKEIALHLEELIIESLEEAAKVADRYSLTHKSHVKGQTSKKAASHDHSSPKDESQKQQRNPSSDNSSEGRYRDRKCFQCHKIGHLKYQCPEVTRNVKPTLLVQSDTVPRIDRVSNEASGKNRLGSLEKFRNYISQGMVKVNPETKDGRIVTVLRDTASGQSMILESALPEGFQGQNCDCIIRGLS